ncbi:MAG: hypothetical protein AAF985_26510, partial [Bacteroidota bacterium]
LFSLSANTLLAQDKVRNETNCDLSIRVAYGPTGTCSSTGIIDAVVPPGTSIVLGIPTGTEIIAAKGGYTLTLPGCAFFVALPCAGGPISDFVPCTAGNCVDYKAVLYPGIGIRIYD